AGGEGFATYRITVRTEYKGIAGLKILDAACSYRMWVNGNLISENGNPGKTRNETVPFYSPRCVFFTCDGKDIEIIVQVSNFSHRKGGLWESVTFGSAQTIQNEREKNIIIALFLSGALVIMAFYHFGFFFFRRKDYSTLFFGLLCVLVTLRTGMTGERVFIGALSFLPWEITQKIEYISAFLSVPAFILFTTNLFREESASRAAHYAKKTLVAAGLILSLITVIFPMKISSWTIDPFYPYILISAIFVFIIMIRAIAEKKDGAVLIVIGFIAFAAAATNDILNSSLTIYTGNYAAAGLFIFILSQSYVISLLFSRAFQKVEVLTKKLTENNSQLKTLNSQLEQKNREITQR
ncbi:MAG: 7TM-DISM domain-containing protein, partial [Spirochaetota bacterium]